MLTIIPFLVRSQHPETRRETIDQSLKFRIQILHISIGGGSLKSLEVMCDLQSATFIVNDSLLPQSHPAFVEGGDMFRTSARPSVSAWH